MNAVYDKGVLDATKSSDKLASFPCMSASLIAEADTRGVSASAKALSDLQAEWRIQAQKRADYLASPEVKLKQST